MFTEFDIQVGGMPWAMTAFSFVYLIPLVIFIAGLIVFVANKEKANVQM